jgi:hypothetical protein
MGQGIMKSIKTPKAPKPKNLPIGKLPKSKLPKKETKAQKPKKM